MPYRRIPVGRSLKVPVVTRSDYAIQFEHSDDKTFIHCAVFAPWSKSVKEKLMADFETLKSLTSERIYAAHDPLDLKHEKFLRMFGFKPRSIIDGADGKTTIVYST